MYSLSLASVCSQVCLLCSTHCWPDFLSCSHQSGIPREKREQTEARERKVSLCERGIWFIVLANLLNRSQEEGVYGFRGRSEVMLTLRPGLYARRINQPLSEFTNIYSCNSAPAATHCEFLHFVWGGEEGKAREASISFEFACMTLCQPIWKTPMLWYSTLLLVLFKNLTGRNRTKADSRNHGAGRKPEGGAYIQTQRLPRCKLTI